MDTELSIHDLEAGYGSITVLHRVELNVGAAPLALIGRNGQGKSTLCKAIMGLIPVRCGSIRLDGAELSGLSPDRIARSGIGYVPQGRRLFPSLSVEEHLRLANARRGSHGRRSVERIYDLFPRLGERRRNGGAQLSGGEAQMLAIGRALMTDPKFLVLDEPTEGLAPVIVERVIEVLTSLGENGVRLLLVEQNIGVATAVAPRVAIMVNGRIVSVEDSARLSADKALQRRHLGIGGAPA